MTRINCRRKGGLGSKKGEKKQSGRRKTNLRRRQRRKRRVVIGKQLDAGVGKTEKIHTSMLRDKFNTGLT
jgi:hypothetical protein